MANTKQQSAPKAPTHRAFHVREGKNGGKGFWTPIGAAWAHDDGNGFNIQIDVMPLDGKIVLRTPKDGEQAG
jgi:hypothetical protein